MHVLNTILREVLGSFLLALLFAVPALYNNGIEENFLGAPAQMYTAIENGLLPPWAYAVVVGLGVFLVYVIASQLTGRAAHLNPIVTSFVIITDLLRGYYSAPGYALLELLGYWLMQAAGTFAGAALAYAFANERIRDVALYLDSAQASSAQSSRALIGELAFGFAMLAIVVILLRVYTFQNALSKEGKIVRVRLYLVWSLGIAAFLLVYMIVLWVYTKSTVDFIRGGAYCVFFTVANAGEKCTTIVGSTSWLLYYIILLVEGAVCLVSVAFATCFAAWSDRYQTGDSRQLQEPLLFARKMRKAN